MKPVIGPKVVAPPREPPIDVAGQKVSTKVAKDIHRASSRTGASFGYLMAQAAKESNFANEAKSAKSSAAGMFQFTKQTWLQMIKEHGAAHGLDEYAAAITRSSKGEYSVADPELRKTILDLRRDPQVSSVMAGEYAKGNANYLERRLGRKVGDTDLYMAHFLGPAGAAKLLKANDEDGDQPAADILPKAAKANPTIFYADQSARSVAAVYDKIRHAIERPVAQYAKIEERVARDRLASDIAAVPTVIQPPAELGIPDEEPEVLVAENEPVATGSERTGDVEFISQPMPPRREIPSQPASSNEGASDKLRNWARAIFG